MMFMFFPFIILLIVISAEISFSLDSKRLKHHKDRHFHTTHMSKSVSIAKEKIANKKKYFNNTRLILSENEKLAINFVFTGSLTDEESSKYIKCSISKLKTNLLPNNPSDIFIWVPEGKVPNNFTPKWLYNVSDVYIMEIQKEVWFVPSLSNDSLWVGRESFELDYYLVGRWRLTFR